MASERLPGKVLAELNNRSVLNWVTDAAFASNAVDEVVVATSVETSDDPVEEECYRLGLNVYRGSLDDLLDRYVNALDGRRDGTAVVRLTADCPFVDPKLVAMSVTAFESAGVDYLSTIRSRSLPRGLDVEVMTLGALRAIHPIAKGYQRSHVTPAIYQNPGEFNLVGISFEPRADDLRVTVDTPEDLQAVRAIAGRIGNRASNWRDLVAFLRSHPEIVDINRHVKQKALEEG